MSRRTLSLSELMHWIEKDAIDEQDIFQIEDFVSSAIQLVVPAPRTAMDNVRRAVRTMTHAQLNQVRAALGRVNDALWAQKETKRSAAAAPATRAHHGWSVVSEMTLCGKAECRCQTGERHGPYFYGYGTFGGKKRKKYFGRKKPTPAILEAATAEVLGATVDHQAEKAPKKKAARR